MIRFSYAEAMTDPTFYGPLARAAEEAGFDSFVVPESIAYPRDSATGYPYVEGGGREFLEDKPFIDPFVLAGSLSFVSDRSRADDPTSGVRNDSHRWFSHVQNFGGAR